MLIPNVIFILRSQNTEAIFSVRLLRVGGDKLTSAVFKIELLEGNSVSPNDFILISYQTVHKKKDQKKTTNLTPTKRMLSAK